PPGPASPLRAPGRRPAGPAAGTGSPPAAGTPAGWRLARGSGGCCAAPTTGGWSRSSTRASSPPATAATCAPRCPRSGRPPTATWWSGPSNDCGRPEPWPAPAPGGYGEPMRTLGNILWLVLAGWWLALAYVLAGVVACVLIVTIPVGLASFRLASYALWPSGRRSVFRADFGPWTVIGNILWILVLGWELAIAHLVAG